MTGCGAGPIPGTFGTPCCADTGGSDGDIAGSGGSGGSPDCAGCTAAGCAGCTAAGCAGITAAGCTAACCATDTAGVHVLPVSSLV